MPVNRSIGRYNKELGKVVWTEFDDTPPESVTPAVEGIKEIRAVGLPGNPVFTSRKSYEKAIRDSGHVIVGNEKCSRAPTHQDLVSRDPKKHTRRTR